MTSAPPLPLDVIYQVIDELGETFRHDRTHLRRPRWGHAHKALLACSLVSKSWAHCSRSHIFRTVRISVCKDEPNPPTSILPYVKELSLRQRVTRASQAASVPDFLKMFATSPIGSLVIHRVVFANKRAFIQEFINAHSVTLRRLEFQECLLSPHNFSDVVLGHHRLKRFSLNGCEFEGPSSDLEEEPPVVNQPEPDTCAEPSELELLISGVCFFQRYALLVTTVARLPHRFSTLDIRHFAPRKGSPAATNALIKANGDVLSSLRIRIWAERIESGIEPKHLFSLEDCSNLSGLTLDMEYSESCPVQDSIFILSTLNLKRTDHLRIITLETHHVASRFKRVRFRSAGSYFGAGDGDQEDDDDDKIDAKVNWEGLDDVLSKLAKVSLRTREKRLTFILVVLQWRDNDEFTPTEGNRLPELLPRFNELGSLHVHYERDSYCRVVDDSPLSNDQPDCLRLESGLEFRGKGGRL